MPDNPELSESSNDELIIQRRLGNELRRSFSAFVEEPLPERMALLLMELALAQSLRLKDNNHEGNS